MRPSHIVYESLSMELGSEFDRYVVEHPGFAAKLPKGAVIVLQMEGNPGFNKWVRHISLKHAEPGKPVVVVRVKGLRRSQSRLRGPIKVEVAA